MADKKQNNLDENQITIDSILNPELAKVIKKETEDLEAQMAREKVVAQERISWMGNPQPRYNDAGREISIENGYAPADIEELERESF